MERELMSAIYINHLKPSLFNPVKIITRDQLYRFGDFPKLFVISEVRDGKFLATNSLPGDLKTGDSCSVFKFPESTLSHYEFSDISVASVNILFDHDTSRLFLEDTSDSERNNSIRRITKVMSIKIPSFLFKMEQNEK